MTARLARTADGWWLVTPAGLVRLGLEAANDGRAAGRPAALDAAVSRGRGRGGALAVPAGSLDLLSPVTAPARIVAQAVNYRSHAVESGFDPDKIPPVFFRKSSHSLTGPAGDIIRPPGVGFLDYEVELGLVIGADLPVGTTVTQETLHHYVAGAGGHQRRQRPADPAHQDAVLRGQVLSHLHPGRAVAGPGRRRGPGQARLAAAHPQRQRRGPPGRAGRGDDRHPGPGADRAVEVPAAGARRSAAHRHPRRDRAARRRRRPWRSWPACCRPQSSGRCSSGGRRATPVTCATET